MKRFRGLSLLGRPFPQLANYSLRRACEIRLRAERKAGQLLAETVQRGGSKSRESTLNKVGISKDQSSRWQQRAPRP
jgi:hypothetical protein